MEPGQRAYEAVSAGKFADLHPAMKAQWAAVEAALAPALSPDVAALVERLRNSGEFEVRHAAADAMQAQAAEIERLGAENVALRQAALTHVKLQNRAEAKVREAVEYMDRAAHAFEMLALHDNTQRKGIIPSVRAAELRDFLATMEKPND
jgi:hypothetical protein